jgi:hypothetical protein
MSSFGSKRKARKIQVDEDEEELQNSSLIQPLVVREYCNLQSLYFG